MSVEIRGQKVEGGGEIDLEQAMLDPGSIFASPEALRDQRGLTREQKIEILRRWAYDARQLSVAEDEGMMGGEPSSLDEILSVLNSLAGGYDAEHRPPKMREVA
ncbi:MAG: hypothetical protein P8Z30_04100 [Acidobacteriota bacterium]